jgi:hypothetical protein
MATNPPFSGNTSVSARGGSGSQPTDPPACWRLSTPAERPGAIAVIQVRGDIERALGGLGIAPVAVGEVRVRDLAGIDRGVVARVKRDLAFLMPHGGPETVRQLTAALTRAGFPRDDHDRARSRFPEARSPFEAELLDALARAASPRAVDLLLDQPARWVELGHALPDLDTPAPDPVHSARLGRLLTPPLVVAVGASNIGKSSLLNRLCGRAVAATADEPGTTRDHVGSLVDLDGLIVRYVDTPGRRPDAPAPEREALALAGALVPAADLVLLLGDRSEAPPEVTTRAPTITIALRADLGLPDWAYEAAVSVLPGVGVADLVVMLRRALVPDEALGSPLAWRFWPDP